MSRTRSVINCFVQVFLVCSSLKVIAQTKDSTNSQSIYHIILMDTRTTMEDGLSFWLAPLRFSGKDWIIAGGTVVGTVGVISADNYLYHTFSCKTEDDLPHSLWQIPTNYGELRYAGIFSVGVYATGLIAGNKNIRITGRLMFESLALSGSVVLMLRYVSARSSPGPNGNSKDFLGFRWDAERQSFPSGHSMVAFALSTVLAKQINNPFIGAGLFGLASLTAYSRIRFDQHWTSDVLVGSAIGFASGLYVVSRQHDREGLIGANDGLSIAPDVDGLHMQYTF
jgi:membrane-associated phospholipid phosphatase